MWSGEFQGGEGVGIGGVGVAAGEEDGCETPGNLAMLLIEGGFETTITVGPEEYRFNVSNPKHCVDTN